MPDIPMNSPRSVPTYCLVANSTFSHRAAPRSPDWEALCWIIHPQVLFFLPGEMELATLRASEVPADNTLASVLCWECSLSRFGGELSMPIKCGVFLGAQVDLWGTKEMDQAHSNILLLVRFLDLVFLHLTFESFSSETWILLNPFIETFLGKRRGPDGSPKCKTLGAPVVL